MYRSGRLSGVALIKPSMGRIMKTSVIAAQKRAISAPAPVFKPAPIRLAPVSRPVTLRVEPSAVVAATAVAPIAAPVSVVPGVAPVSMAPMFTPTATAEPPSIAPEEGASAQQPKGGVPGWLLPAAIAAGLFLFLKRRRSRVSAS